MNLGYLLEQWAKRQPKKEAIIFQDIRLTYKEFDERVNSVCHFLINMGLAKGDRVAILTYNNNQFEEVFFACSRIGMIMVPLNFRMVGRELEYQLNNSGASILILGQEFQNVIESIRSQLTSVKKYIVIGDTAAGMESYETLMARYPKDQPQIHYEVDLQDEFLIIYTSGTTGRPKGALLTQMNVLFTSLNQIIDMQCTTKDIALTMAPMFHVGGSLLVTLPVLHVGGTIVIMKSFDPVKALKFIQKEKVSVIFAAPAMWTSIMQVPEIEKADLSSLRFTISGGASQPVAVMKKIHSIFNAPFTEGYGLSEASSSSALLMWEYAMDHAGSIGMPFIHNEIKVVNEKGKEVKPGETGELVQKSLTVMKGYFNNPEATSEAIIDGWLHTGDLATVDEDGFIYIKGRKKEMIISGAENIYPIEIEQVLDSHPKILESAVVGIPDEKWGEAVLALVVLKPGHSMTAEEAINHCKEHLASYKKPRSVVFMDRLPRNPSGKVVKNTLREQFGGSKTEA